MIKNLLLFLASFSLASLILVISIFKLAQVNYAFSDSPNPTPVNSPSPIEINYNLPYPGGISSDSPLWPLKALRDKVWVSLTVNPAKKADLYLLFADKRLADAQNLFTEGNADLGVSVLTKAEKYLQSADSEEEIAKSAGMDTTSFLQRYLMATLKHRQVIDQILTTAPEDARPLIIKTENYSKDLYFQARNGLLEAGISVPQSPYQQN